MRDTRPQDYTADYNQTANTDEIDTTGFVPIQTILPSQKNSKQTNDASMQASMLASNSNDAIQSIRQVVRKTGKETVFVRVTESEKSDLGDVVHKSKRYRKKITENELARIAINHLILDYQNNREHCFLVKVLKALES